MAGVNPIIGPFSDALVDSLARFSGKGSTICEGAKTVLSGQIAQEAQEDWSGKQRNAAESRAVFLTARQQFF